MDKIQPFRGKFILLPPNTNYVLTNIEPEQAPVPIQPFFSLYQTYDFQKGQMVLQTDNSSIYDVNNDWSQVKISSK